MATQHVPDEQAWRALLLVPLQQRNVAICTARSNNDATIFARQKCTLRGDGQRVHPAGEAAPTDGALLQGAALRQILEIL